MKIRKFKILSLIIFLLVIVPYGKLEVFNIFLLLINVTLIFTKGVLHFGHYMILFLTLFGIYLIIFKNNFHIIIGFILSYIWLIYKVELNDLNNNLSIIISIIVYLMSSIYTTYLVIFKRVKDK